MNIVEVVVNAYLIAGIPIGAAWLAGEMSPMYKLPEGTLTRYWGWMALIIVVSAIIYGCI